MTLWPKSDERKTVLSVFPVLCFLWVCFLFRPEQCMCSAPPSCSSQYLIVNSADTTSEPGLEVDHSRCVGETNWVPFSSVLAPWGSYVVHTMHTLAKILNTTWSSTNKQAAVKGKCFKEYDEEEKERVMGGFLPKDIISAPFLVVAKFELTPGG